ncbi:MAG: hypothetical protein AAB037_06815, partial [Chloroflexota bacterium]
MESISGGVPQTPGRGGFAFDGLLRFARNDITELPQPPGRGANPSCAPFPNTLIVASTERSWPVGILSVPSCYCDVSNAPLVCVTQLDSGFRRNG